MNILVEAFSKIAAFLITLLGLVFLATFIVYFANPKTSWLQSFLLLLPIPISAGLASLLYHAVEEDNQQLALIGLGILSLPIILLCLQLIFRFGLPD